MKSISISDSVSVSASVSVSGHGMPNMQEQAQTSALLSAQFAASHAAWRCIKRRIDAADDDDDGDDDEVPAAKA